MEKEIKLQPFQWKVIESQKPYILALAGKQSGKTFIGSVWAAKKMAEYPDLNGLIAAPTYKILNQSTLEKFFQLFPEIRKFYKQQQGVIDGPKGKVFIRSTDEPLGLEGMTLKWAWLDEAGMMSFLVWNIIRPRLAVQKGQLLMTTSPHYINWLHTNFYQEWEKAIKQGKTTDLEVIKWKTAENKYFDKEFLSREKTRLTPEEFARFYEGEFVRMSGLVYNLTDDLILDELNVRFEQVIGGIDWGFNNPSAVVIIGIKDGVYYIIDEFYEVGKTTDEILQECYFFQEKYNVNEWYPDPAEPDRLEEMRRRGFYVKNTNKDIKYGISKIQELINQRRVRVLRKCNNIIEEFNFYHYDEENPNPKNKDLPVKDKDHAMDAIRYAIVGHLPMVIELRSSSQIFFNRRLYKNRFE